ncbi:MAG: glucose-1-phosphate cytidylyltransferase [Deltaproteobacteria bacterium]|nr:glucose-1-phosphate cytidylyltransferase [Deltaproteobacteria bacterium]
MTIPQNDPRIARASQTYACDTPVVILCGGRGTRFREQTERRPKPMIEVAGRPLIWHIMRFYSGHGFNNFVLCLGYMGDGIKRYFLNFAALENDFTLRLSDPDSIEYHRELDVKWNVTCVDTGSHAMTGARLKRVAQYLTSENFMLTYGDGLSNVDIPRLLDFHLRHGKLATVTGVHPAGRFGELCVSGSNVTRFSEKPVESGRINGGFFVFRREFLDYVSDEDSCVLEREPLEAASDNGELQMFSHDGYWQCMDTFRDLTLLESAWNGGDAPWRTW